MEVMLWIIMVPVAGLAFGLFWKGERGYAVASVLVWAAAVALYYGDQVGPTWPGSLVLILAMAVLIGTSLKKRKEGPDHPLT